MNYRKLWFSGRCGNTAGMVVTQSWIEAHKTGLITAASRLFPTSEAGKMSRLHISNAFDTWADAFAYEVQP